MAAAAAATVTVAACTRRDEAQALRGDRDGATLGAAGPVPSAAPLPSHEPIDPAAADAAHLAPVTLVSTRVVEGGTPVRDPDEPILDDARTRAARCFTGLPARGPRTRTATVALTVIPTGTVSRAEVRSADTAEPFVIDCLRRLGQDLKLTELPSRMADGGSAGLRTYAIEVTVVASDH